MINHETLSREKEIEIMFKEVANLLYNRKVDFASIENTLSKLKDGGAITYDHLLCISDENNWPNFYNWYLWPEKARLEESLSRTKDKFIDLKKFSALERKKQQNIENNLFKILFDIFKNIELVSILLRFIDPTNFAIYSPPVAYDISSPRGGKYIIEYTNYLEELRKFRHILDIEKVAYIDMYIWSLAKVQQEKLDYSKISKLKNEHDYLISERNYYRLSNTLKDIVKGKADLDLAYIFMDAKAYRMAARSAGVAFEEAVIEKCKENKIDLEAKTLEDLCIELTQKCNKSIENLIKVRRLRNRASHADKKPFSNEEVELMIGVTNIILSW